MASITSEQLNELADDFLAMAGMIGDYRIQNYDLLSYQQNKILKEFQSALLNSADELFTLSAITLEDDVQTALGKIGDLTDQMKNTFQTLKDIQKAIDIAASALNLGKAICKTDPQAIISALNSLNDLICS
jgi:hypothetical protein